MTTVYTELKSPLGAITLVAEQKMLIGLYMADQRHGCRRQDFWQRDDEDEVLSSARAQLSDYFRGSLKEFIVPLLLKGTEFQRQVWHELAKIPYGTTISYKELGRRVGNPAAARAVGLANGRNPISIIIPCHRVIGVSGELTGYGGGLPRKRALLNHEASVLATGMANSGAHVPLLAASGNRSQLTW
jgi:methylated-DNA-[protein]-cysteine S-methyltransferase